MNKIYWATLSETETEAFANQVNIKGSFKKELEVSVVDKKGKKIKRYLDVKGGEHKVLITMKFQWGVVENEDTSTDSVEYIFKKADDYWEIDSDNQDITVKKRDEFEKAGKVAHKNLLKQEFGDRINIDDKQEIKETDMRYIILEDGEGNYKANIYLNNSSEDKQFSWKKVEIKPQYGLTKQVDFNTLFNINYQNEKKPSWWTSGRILFCVVFSTIIVLGVIFGEKVWKLIKGERKQEKKIKEQLDIF